MDENAEFMAVTGELFGAFDQDPLLDIMKNFLVTRFVADEKQAQAVLPHDLERLVRNVGLGVA